MVTFLFTSVLVLGLIAIALYFWQKPANRTESIELPAPPRVTSLFPSEEPKQLAATQNVAPVAQPEDNKALPDKLIEPWRRSPDRSSTARLLHAAALSDNADTYSDVVELVFSFWQHGKLPDLSATELQTLFNGEFWLLSSSTRSSGAGFVLKRTLSRANRELERANPQLNHQRPPVD